MPKVVILSPHLDDAVLNCWYTINRNDSMVLTIFAGIPKKGTTKFWDLLCGERDSNLMVQNRRQENENALSGTGCEVRNLDYLDDQYRGSHFTVDMDQVLKDILNTAPDDAIFLAPLAASRLFRHEDHVLTRDLGIRLLKENRIVQFYPDSPYMSLPTRPNKKYNTKLSATAEELVGRKFAVNEQTMTMTEQIKKLRALEAYRSQYKMTNLISLGGIKRIIRRPFELVVTPE